MSEQAVAFEALVEDYDAARPSYPDSLYDALPPLSDARVLERGAGTGKQLPGLLARGARIVSTDRGPNMLGRLNRSFPDVPVAVARAEQLPFTAGCFDGVCGAQMWHWVDAPVAAREVARVLRPGGWLALWWNDVAADGEPWYDAQQDRLEAASVTGYRREYRTTDYTPPLREVFSSVHEWSGTWNRTLSWELYERWLRSKSYVAALPDTEAFLAAERASMGAAFPDGRIVEPFRVRLLVARLERS